MSSFAVTRTDTAYNADAYERALHAYQRQQQLAIAECSKTKLVAPGQCAMEIAMKQPSSLIVPPVTNLASLAVEAAIPPLSSSSSSSSSIVPLDVTYVFVPLQQPIDHLTTGVLRIVRDPLTPRGKRNVTLLTDPMQIADELSSSASLSADWLSWFQTPWSIDQIDRMWNRKQRRRRHVGRNAGRNCGACGKQNNMGRNCACGGGGIAFIPLDQNKNNIPDDDEEQS
jgi:hypothetical protein